MTNKEILKKIEERFGKPITYSQECEALVEAIYEATGERLGTTTLKRYFGLVSERVIPRKSTLDIIAQYIGYPSYKLLVADMGSDTDISAFSLVDGVDVTMLENGTQIQLTYDPNRLIVMTYLGDFQFIVNESQGSKLRKGDVLKVTHLDVGYELIAQTVIRDGNNLGQYIAGKEGGLTSIEVIN